MLKVSVLSLPCDDEEICNVLCLFHSGMKMGLLRGMDCRPIEEGANIELAAISCGSATRKDLDAAYEESKDREASKNRAYYRQKLADMNIWLDQVEWWDEIYYDQMYSSCHPQTRAVLENEVFNFYNVLWIERKGNLAFRRAAGRVSKQLWDAHNSGPVELLLA